MGLVLLQCLHLKSPLVSVGCLCSLFLAKEGVDLLLVSLGRTAIEIGCLCSHVLHLVAWGSREHGLQIEELIATCLSLLLCRLEYVVVDLCLRDIREDIVREG